MKILLVGGGGREHALAWKISQSKKCSELFCAPGNAGIEQSATCVPVAADDIEGLVDFASEKNIDLVVIGPEAPLVAGLTDRLVGKGIKVFGPTQAAARLEGSKKFMKEICIKYGIRTATYGSYTDLDKAKAFIRNKGAPIVVKADGLAAGKGVIIAETIEEAEDAVTDMLSGQSFGDAGRSVVIEEFLKGHELSFFALADGKGFVSFGSAQDHKRAFDNDEGPNTGGMGTCSPAPMMTAELQRKIEDTIIRPVIDGMAAEGCPFTGVLFLGLMLVAGEPVLLEINTRFGDPECQTLMMRLESDLVDILLAGAEGRLAEIESAIGWTEQAAVCVVMAARGYPGAYDKGSLIENIEQADRLENTKVFHAGTARDAQGNIVSFGGRVLGVTARGETITQARQNAYKAVQTIRWPEGFCRSDIGLKAEKSGT